MNFNIDINSCNIITRYNGLPSKDNVFWSVSLFTPTVYITLNESDDYSNNQFRLAVNAHTGFNFQMSDKGSTWRIEGRLVGFGFSLFRQSDW